MLAAWPGGPATSGGRSGRRIAARLRHRNRRDLDSGSALSAHSKVVGCVWANVDDPPRHVRPAVLDLDGGGAAVLDVGHTRCAAKRQRLARRHVRVRVEAGARRGTPSRKAGCIVGCSPPLRGGRSVGCGSVCLLLASRAIPGFTHGGSGYGKPRGAKHGTSCQSVHPSHRVLQANL